MEPTGGDRIQDQRLSSYHGINSDNFGEYNRIQSPAVGQVSHNQNWQTQSPAANPIAGWNHNLQPPSRQHTPNTNPQFGQNGYSHYTEPFGNGSHPSTQIQQSQYNWSGYPTSGFTNDSLDPSLSDSTIPGNGLNFHQGQYQVSPSFQHTIAPAALENSSNAPILNAHSQPSRAAAQYQSPTVHAASTVPLTTYNVELPSSVVEGSFRIIPQAGLAAATESRALTEFLNLSVDAQEFLKVSRSATTPAAPRRKSRNVIKKLAASDPKLLAKLAKGKSKTKWLKSQAKAQKLSAPGQSVVRPGSIASTPSSLDSSDNDSEYDSSDDDLDIIESPPYAEKRPDDPVKAVAYDTIKAVWLPRRKQPTPDQIREGLRAFWEVLSTIRNRWKSDGDALKKAEEAKKHSEIPMLKDRVKSQRTMLGAALTAALEHGHPEVLRLMGENRPFLQMTYLFTADRVRDSDVNGALSRELLKILVRCTTVSQEALEEFKLKKVLALYTKRGDEEIKKLVKQIEEVAAASSKEKAEKTKADNLTDKKDNTVKSGPTTTNRVPAPVSVAGVKRAPPNALAGAQPAKKALPSSAAATKSTTVQKGSPSAAEKRATPVNATKSAPTVVSKTTNLYAGLKSASKKPGTAIVEKKITAQAEKKGAPPAPTMASKSSAFSFKDYMADLSKPKEPEKPKEKKTDRGPETEEQKRKRERKEARRGLRVQFKTGSALEEVRVFEHDPEEESGHDASMTRDVGDVQSEGRMFKQHIEQMDLEGEMDMDIDDDKDESANNERLIDHNSLSAVDFGDIDNQQRLSSYDKYGGYKHAVSKERDIQDQHESNTLLAVYLNSADIPPNPREPADPYDGEHMDGVKDFGLPPKSVDERASRFRPQHATPAWPAPQANSTFSTPSASVAGSTPDLNAILASLASHGPASQQPAYTPPAPTPAPMPPQQQVGASTVPTGFENLFATFQQFSQPTQTDQPQQQGTTLAAVQPAPAADLGSLLASLQGQTSTAPPHPQVQSTVPIPPPFPNMLPAAASGGAPPMDWASMMAAMAQAGLPPPPMPGMPPLPGFAPPMQQQNSNNSYEHPDRKRMLDGADDDSEMSKKGKWDSNGAKKKWNKGEKPKWVLPCKFYKEGRCTKGAACTYVHD